MESKTIFHDFLLQYISFFDDMVEIQKEQLAAVLSEDLARVDKSASNLQVFLKKLNSMEQKRIDLQNEAGYGSMTFKEIIVALPQEEQEEYSAIFDKLGKRISEVVFYNNKAQEKVKSDLRTMGNNENSPSVYNAKKEQSAADGVHGLLNAKA